ncbi:hypothetical protein LJ739_16255 [Aestuariibacter halophilus]|uniref:DUF3718 domain-containing protein n=1 Tax=Fluctibacter halophilus TaxID=226011 RepID=A0ABS8GD65_9ALTE|nr:hypothetical protein [Aestuariibacter halophilus]MCC2617805.1 hypothetical protein [Aestuariibacter halophilus]
MNKKTFALLATLSLGATSVHAVNLVSGDNSNLTAMCIAAATSDDAMDAKAKEYGFSKAELESFSCNGMTLNEFAKKYRDDTSGQAVVVYTFENTGDNRESELCIAAATSNEAYKEAKQRLFGGKVGQVACNGLSIDKFAKRYGNRGFKM